MTYGVRAQGAATPGLFFERRYSARTLFNLQARQPVEGPVYQQTPQKQWAQLSCALSGCGSLKDLAKKVYTELEPESEGIESGVKSKEPKSRVSKNTYQCRCGCGTTIPPEISPVSADSRSLAAILQSTNLNIPANLQNTSATQTSENYFAKW